MRLDKDTEAARQLAGARDTSELLRVQADYFRTAAADYVQGTQQLMECGAEVSREILTPLKEQADKAAEKAERGAEGGNIRADVAA
jgi:phasin family protein